MQDIDSVFCEAGSDVHESVSNECLIGIRGRRGAKKLGVVGTHVASVVANVGLRLVVLGGTLRIGLERWICELKLG